MLSKKTKGKFKRTNFGFASVLLYHNIKKQFTKRLTDEEFAIMAYEKEGLGFLDLKNPTTFDEKLWWLKINYRDPVIVDCTDKIKVREYVAGKGFGHILNEIYSVYKNTDEINWSELPNEFYFKTNQSSATNIYIKDKYKIQKKSVVRRLNLFLKKDHYSLSREWNYKNIEPSIFTEKVLKCEKGLTDYRFFCSYGEVNGLFVDIDTAEESGEHNVDAKRNVYDKDLNLMDVTVSRPRFDNSNFKMPLNILEMKNIAEILSKPFPFCRVDLYNINGIIIFGELTFFHSGGVNEINPPIYQNILGGWIGSPDQ